jgi:hypothetical protein
MTPTLVITFVSENTRRTRLISATEVTSKRPSERAMELTRPCSRFS